MSDKFLTLLDITKRNGTDQAVGLVEEVTTVAKELDSISGRPIAGTTYKTRVRTALPAGPAFRNPNEGSDVVSSTYAQKISQCFFLDAQFQVDEAVADAPEEGGRESVLADEASGATTQKMIMLGSQFYYGTDADAKGFAGLVASYDSTNALVKAGGTTADAQTSAWIVWNDLKGVHFIWGQKSGLQMNAWTRQQVTDANGRKFFAYVNNLSGWIGLSFNHSLSAVRIANCEDATNKNLSDAVISRALEKLPLQIRENGNLKIFMNRKARGQLQRSRSVTIFSGAGGKPTGSFENVAPVPSEAFGVPIICTDSITNTEPVVA
jgi:hypothetical protein